MGGAILDGLLASGFDAAKVTVSTKSQVSAQKYFEQLGVAAFSIEEFQDANRRAVAEADVVLVAVKPAYVTEVLEEVASDLKTDALVISVAAGVKNETMQRVVPDSVAVIRSMPNTPAIISRAVTGIAPGERASDLQLQTAIDLFLTVGKVVVVDEDQIDQLSTISGSGPAYVFFLIEQLTAAAKHHGFDEEAAALLVNETFLGAAELLIASGKTPQELRRQVTSPNGTTERAIARLQQADLAELFIEATEAALARARELAAGA